MVNKETAQKLVIAFDGAIEELKKKVRGFQEEIHELELVREKYLDRRAGEVEAEKATPAPRREKSTRSRILAGLKQVADTYTLNDLQKIIEQDGEGPLDNEKTFITTHHKFKGKYFEVIKRGTKSEPGLFKKISSQGGA